MRDLALLIRTLHAMRDDGAGWARRLRISPRRFAWFAGQVALDGQAMHDLMDDGWLNHTPETDHAHIAEWPAFAGPTGD